MCEQKPQTIVAFDVWLRGMRHFTRIAPDLRARGYDLIVVHFGSWGHDSGRPKEEVVDGISTRDISWYARGSVQAVLETEQPSGILVLQAYSLALEIPLILGRRFGIPTFHLAHGVISRETMSKAGSRGTKPTINHLLKIQRRLVTNILTILPRFVSTLMSTRSGIRYWFDMLREIHHRATNRPIVRYPVASRTDVSMVYLESDRAAARRGFANEEPPVIHVVGNPDIVDFRLAASDIACWAGSDAGAHRIVTYLETGFLTSGDAYKSRAEFVAHLVQTKTTVEEAGYELRVKLHPKSVRSGLVEDISEAGIQLCSQADFVDTLRRSVAAITEPSSVAMIPAIMGLPVLFAGYGPLNGMDYRGIIDAYPRGERVESLSKLVPSIDRQKYASSNSEIRQWIASNVGTYEDSVRMPATVACIIDDFVSGRSRAGAR